MKKNFLLFVVALFVFTASYSQNSLVTIGDTSSITSLATSYVPKGSLVIMGQSITNQSSGKTALFLGAGVPTGTINGSGPIYNTNNAQIVFGSVGTNYYPHRIVTEHNSGSNYSLMDFQVYGYSGNVNTMSLNGAGRVSINYNGNTGQQIGSNLQVNGSVAFAVYNASTATTLTLTNLMYCVIGSPSSAATYTLPANQVPTSGVGGTYTTGGVTSSTGDVSTGGTYAGTGRIYIISNQGSATITVYDPTSTSNVTTINAGASTMIICGGASSSGTTGWVKIF